jgi:hypothetical protein
MADKLLCNLLINRQSTRAQAKGDNRTAIVRFERAAALQAALPYTEYWYYPIRRSLAATLLQAGRYAEAKRQFQRASSEHHPMAGRTTDWRIISHARHHRGPSPCFSGERQSQTHGEITSLGDQVCNR